jgi:hypothetical protein
VEHGPLPQSDFIPNDGHPTAEGNRHFAELIGSALDRSPVASRLTGEARTAALEANHARLRLWRTAG